MHIDNVKFLILSKFAYTKFSEKPQASAHKNAILATIRYGISNARMEATNNKVKLTIRMAYGFRNIDHLISAIFLRCGNLPIYFPSRQPLPATHTL